jgi:regulator of sirC expression with transglutaminase-like and TPR domain
LQGLFGLVFTERAELRNEASKNADVIDRLGKLMDKIDSVSAKALKVHKALTATIQFLIGLVTDSDEKLNNEQSPPDSIEE